MADLLSKEEKNISELAEPICRNSSEVTSAEYHDYRLDGVIYRVWSAFEDKTTAENSLSELMLRELESGTEEETETVNELPFMSL